LLNKLFCHSKYSKQTIFLLIKGNPLKMIRIGKIGVFFFSKQV
jgi:hypothetical protein